MRKQVGIILFMMGLLLVSLSGCYKGTSIGSMGAIQGTVVRSDGGPASGAIVSFDGNSDVTVNDKGVFIAKLGAGKSYRVQAKLGSNYSSDVVISPRLASGKPTDIGRIILKGKGNISGQVNDNSGSPLVGATVHIKDSNGTIVATGTTDSSGNIKNGNGQPITVPEGTYIVEISGNDGSGNSISVTIPSVVVSANGTADLGSVVAQPDAGKATVSGTVYASSNTALTNVRVQFKKSVNSTLVESVMTGTGGNYTAQVGLDTYSINYSKIGYYPFVLHQKKVDASLTLPKVLMTATSAPTGNISGTLIAGGSAQGNVSVTVVNSSGAIVGNAVTGSNGSFSITNIPEGTYTVIFDGNTIETITVEGVTVVAGKTVSLGTVTGETASGLTGTFKDQNGNPVSGATVVLKDSNGNVIASVSSGENGSFTFDNIPAGSGYTIEVTKDGFDTIVYNGENESGFSVSNGQYTNIGDGEAVTFNKSEGAIRLTVKDKDAAGQPVVPGLSIQLGSESKTTNNSGQVLFGGIASHTAHKAIFSGTNLYSAGEVVSQVLGTNTTLDITLLISRKKAVVTQDSIKLGDNNSIANGGTVKICNDALLPEVNGEHCVSVGIENGAVNIPDLPYGGGYSITITYSDDYDPISAAGLTINSPSLSLQDLTGTAVVFQPSSSAKSGMILTVTDGQNVLKGVSVKINTQTFTTNDSGKIETQNTLALGDYTVIVNQNSSSNWLYAEKALALSLNQVNDPKEETITLTKKKSTVSFTVKKENGSAAVAQVTFNGQTQNADINGIATFSNVEYAESYNYSISSTGYLNQSGVLKVDSSVINKNIDILLDSTQTYTISGDISEGGIGSSTATSITVKKSDGTVIKTVSSSNGSYSVDGLVGESSYTLVASKAYYADITKVVAVSTSDVSGKDFAFSTSGTGEGGGRLKGSLSGSINLSDANGEAGTVTISLSGPQNVSTTITAPTGTFSFNDIYQGEYELSISYGAYETITQTVMVQGDGQTLGSIAMTPNYATLNFSIQSNSADLSVSTSGASVEINGTTYSADSNGNLSVQVKAGTYSYKVSKQYFVAGSSKSFTVNGGESKTITETLNAYAVIKGYVKNSSQSFPGAVISISGTESASPSLDSNAYFELRVQPGAYTLGISNLGYGYENLSDSFTLSAGEVYSLQADWDPEDNGEGDIGTGADLSPYQLTVNVSGDGSPLNGVNVSIGSSSASTVNGKAVFTVQKGASYNVSVSSLPTGYLNQSTSKTIGVKSEAVNFALTASKIKLSSDAAALTTFKIYDTSGTLLQTKTGTQGQEVVLNMNPSAYKVEASASGYVSETQTKTLAEGSTTSYSFAMTAYAMLNGQFLDSQSGQGVSGVKIEFNGSENKTVFTDSNGNYAVSLKPGTYTYTIDAPDGYQDKTGTITVPGEVLGSVSLNPVGAISGQVVSYTNTGLVGMTVNILNESGAKIASTVTGASGYFNASVAAGYNMSIEVEPTSEYDRSSKSGIRVSAGSTTNVGKIYMPDKVDRNDGAVQGIVVDAVSGNRLSNATVEIHIGGANGPIAQLIKSDGATAGVNATAITNSTGFFKVGSESSGDNSLLDGQIYTIVVKKAGYVYAVAENISVDGLTDIGNIGLSPVLPAGELRITLKWQSDGYDYANKTVSNYTLAGRTRDLDGHLVGPKVDGSGYFHIYYRNLQEESVKQDIDDTQYCTRNGETMTVSTGSSVRAAGTYTYTVHNYTDLYGANNWLASNSNAVVSVYDSHGMLSQVSVEPNSAWAANGWKVFELIVNQDRSYRINVVNAARQISSHSSADGVRSSGGSNDTVSKIISVDVKSNTK